MTKTAFILCLILIFNAQNSIAQEINNLVPNGDFEDVNICFEPINNLWRVPHWTAAVPSGDCSSDYYNKCQISKPWLPKEPMYAVRGSGSAAIIIKSTFDDYREYIQCELLSPLSNADIYVIQFLIRPVYLPLQNEWGVKRIEAFFSKQQVISSINNGLPSIIDTSPSVVFKGDYMDTTIWYQCRAVYKASGNENFLTIGVFSPDSVYDFYPIGDTLRLQWKGAYYLIDDVMVYKASDTIPKQPEPILPNVFSPNQDGVNEVYAIENLPENSTLEVFNRWGSLVFKQAPYLNNWPGKGPNGNPLADGVYFAILTYTDQTGKLQQKKQAVHVVR
jgi:gliding motility-associated-like protein